MPTTMSIGSARRIARRIRPAMTIPIRENGIRISEKSTFPIPQVRRKAKNINLDRKVLADLAVNNPEAFKAIVTAVKEK